MNGSIFRRPDAAVLEADREFRLAIEAFELQVACTSDSDRRRATAIAEAHRALAQYRCGARTRGVRQLRQVTNALRQLNLSALMAEKAIMDADRAADGALAEGAERYAGALWKEGSLALEAAREALLAQRYTQADRLAETARVCFVSAERAAGERHRVGTNPRGLK